MSMKRTLLALAMLAAAAALVPSASAGVMNVTFWQTSDPGGIGDPEEQALPTNPMAAGTPLANFIYNGDLNWTSFLGSDNYLDDFVGTGGGSVSGCAGVACTNATTLGHYLLSTSGFELTSLFRIIFTTTGPVINGEITHDDGASIFDSTNTIAYLDASFPTAAITSNFSLPGAGTYNLWYVEANGHPSVLQVSGDITEQSVPEPGALALIGFALMSLFGFGWMRRRAGI
ncbi:MAG: PEP-CTERM sorting domain-containing protein [Alphaproteobacteria bacterium]|nr:PEP-CTERM sorting domain-containing protein [Alphaproteobacteria bacterium]